ncbi:DUF3618 domain-containing protein [Aeromicrobium sp. 636]|uniref:DUF3618 domain-containing protein n=1 Tax=Aeromicrobium senzhongii TaxID=2663859 RepID=A0A8I0K1K8_9ACTN|nr:MULTISPECIES: DUF3618 domain-containing protein [Aeromicrobium]MBC9224994.1 DUF3618 domain-containing protein [Aeromicrobium senzhongii]MCQ3997105.1 DUF3618 domain-containing protein [Aeromicrobium sp. 636]MTB87039.1 DUF3618 domain-containing protein [Aeromicrobium senzhongii]QNL93141.1 DUF3618 domain-containing protein [Aeromicrobium senzhongii]
MSDENIHELRDEVERTREELADTVDELAAKFDVKSRVKDSANDFKDSTRESLNDFKDSTRESLTDQDGKPRPEVLALAAGITSLCLAFLVLRSLRRGR